MEINMTAMVMGVYAGFVTLGMGRGTVRLTFQPLYDLLKLALLAILTSLTCCDLVAVVLVAMAAFCLYHYLPSPLLPAEGKAVFITGCDRGLGHLLAIHLDAMGVTVFASCLFPDGEGAATLKAKCSPRLRTIPLDVSDPTAVKTAADMVKKELDGKELWGVVNNAGINYVGCMEIMTQADVQRIIDINFLGQLHVTRAFLPLLRRSRGRLVNVASNIGLAPVPFFTAYSASKAAVASMTESLRLELQPLGIGVSTIIPSGYRTGILQYNVQMTGDRWWAQADPEIKASYGKESFYPVNKTKNPEAMLNPDFSGIICKMVDGLLERTPQDFYYKGFLSICLPLLYLHTPTPLARFFYPALATWYKFDPPTNTTSGKHD